MKPSTTPANPFRMTAGDCSAGAMNVVRQLARADSWGSVTLCVEAKQLEATG
jgi:hypothetical protein